MPRASAWHVNNDVLVQLENFRSSTGTSVINSSTGIRVTMWSPTTASTAFRKITNQLMSYVGGSSGTYRYTAQSTGIGLTVNAPGVAIVTANHSGINGEWRVPLRIEYRGAT